MDAQFWAVANEVAQLANVVLIPAVWILYKIDKNIIRLSIWAEFHQKEDDRKHTEAHERIRELELKEQKTHIAAG